jgi:taurine dioxygenase
MTSLEVTPLSRALGAEVRGIDLNAATHDDIEQIRALLIDHLVLFFPGQQITLDAHVSLGRQFGELEVNPNLPGPDGGPPEVVELRASWGGTADEWHTDVTFLPQPSVLSIMHFVDGPGLGGDTMWSNQYLAFSELSAPLQELLRGLSALHDATPHGKPEMTSIHPVVRIHPESGREALFVNEHFTRRIVELSFSESQMLLDHLRQWSSQERFTVRYRWTPGTIAMWDNRCTQHFVVNDFEGERVIQRVTVLGDTPSGPGPRWAPFTSAHRGAASLHDLPLTRHLSTKGRPGSDGGSNP